MLERDCVHDDVIKMETFLVLQAFCAGNSLGTGEFPHEGQVRGDLMFSSTCAWTNSWAKNGDAGDLRRSLWRHCTVDFCSNDEVQRQFEKPNPRRRRRGRQRPQKSRDRDTGAHRVIGGAMLLLLFLTMVAIVIYFVYSGRKWWRHDTKRKITHYWLYVRGVPWSPVGFLYKGPGRGLLSHFTPIRYFPFFLHREEPTCYPILHPYLTSVSSADTWQIWIWFKESNRHFCKIENFACGKINERSTELWYLPSSLTWSVSFWTKCQVAVDFRRCMWRHYHLLY